MPRNGALQWCTPVMLGVVLDVFFFFLLSFHVFFVLCASVVDVNFAGRSNARRQHLLQGFLQNYVVSCYALAIHCYIISLFTCY